MTTVARAVPDPIVVRRQNDLFDLYREYVANHGDDPKYDPDDDLEFVAAAREVMGLPPLDADPTLDEIQAMADEEDGDVERAAGHDVTPGHDELHHWWVYGEGRARWETWTELYDQLAKIPEVGPIKAKTYASAWFHERHGYWSGSDRNRVEHGKPPRGNRIGPG